MLWSANNTWPRDRMAYPSYRQYTVPSRIPTCGVRCCVALCYPYLNLHPSIDDRPYPPSCAPLSSTVSSKSDFHNHCTSFLLRTAGCSGIEMMQQRQETCPLCLPLYCWQRFLIILAVSMLPCCLSGRCSPGSRRDGIPFTRALVSRNNWIGFDTSFRRPVARPRPYSLCATRDSGVHSMCCSPWKVTRIAVVGQGIFEEFQIEGHRIAARPRCNTNRMQGKPCGTPPPDECCAQVCIYMST